MTDGQPGHRGSEHVNPRSAAQPYSMATVVENIVDEGSFLGLQNQFAPHMVTGFARIEAAAWASLPTSLIKAPELSMWMPRRKPRVSSAYAMRSTCRWSRSLIPLVLPRIPRVW